MNKRILVGAIMVLLAGAGRLFAVEADVDGATVGRWTMDLDAAKKVAAEKKLPILLDFSGSDWCGWCKLMESNVFEKAEWNAYATNNVLMVLVDFPQDKSLVPDKYVERNDALQKEYAIEGFPTYVILDDDGTTELGRLSAGQDKTPESFIAELKQALRTRAVEMTKFMDSLDPDKKAAYEAMKAKLEETKQLVKDQMKIMDDAEAKIKELQQQGSDLQSQMELFRMEQQLSADDFKAYKELKGNYDAALKKLQDWIATSPERNDENMKLYQDMISEIKDLEAKLSKY